MVQDKVQKERYNVTLENQEMWILGDKRVIPEVHITVDKRGNICMSFDEYNRIADWVHYQLKRKRAVKYK